MPFRGRRGIAVLCLAIAVFAVSVPAALHGLPLPPIIAAWLLIAAPAPIAFIGVETCPAEEQLLASRSPLALRAPPAH
jgi:hypothetical protein